MKWVIGIPMGTTPVKWAIFNTSFLPKAANDEVTT